MRSNMPNIHSDIHPNNYLNFTGLLLTLAMALTAFQQPVQAFECEAVTGTADNTGDDGGTKTRLACGQDAAATTVDSTAVGGSATASGTTSTALGRSATASGGNSSALGAAAQAILAADTAVGGGATASGSSSTAMGAKAEANGVGSTAVGVLATANGGGTAVGESATVGGLDNTALGSRANALSPHSNATAIGLAAQVEQSNAMVLGSIPGVNLAANYVDVGIGTPAPMAPLHIRREDGTLEFLRLESDEAGGAQDRAMMDLTNNGGIRFQFTNTGTANAWRFQAGTGGNDNFEITKVGSGVLEMVLQNDGDLIIAGALTQNSDVNAKQDIEETDGQMILAKLDELPISEWTYKSDSSKSRHLGPMAQDFHKAFGLGEDETKIAPGDMAGISLAAIKALKEENETLKTKYEKAMAALKAEKDAEIAAHEEQMKELQTELRQSIEELITRLEAVETIRPVIQASTR